MKRSFLKTLHAATVYYREFGLLHTIRRTFEVLADRLIMLIAVMTSFGLIVKLLYLRLCIRPSDTDSGFMQIVQGKRDRVPLVGLLYIGGMGDSLFLSSLAAAVIKKYPKAKIFAFVRDQSHCNLFKGTDLISAVFEVKSKYSYLLRHCLQQLTDIFMEDRFVIKVKNNIATNEEITKCELAFKELDKNWDIFPLDNYRFGNMGLTIYELASRCTGLAVVEDDLTIPLLPDDFNGLTRLIPGIYPYKYITVHHGCDSRMTLPDNSGTDMQSKNWFTDRWEAVVEELSQHGYTVVQLGMDGEPRINLTYNLLGKLTLRETATVLKYAALHLDAEGGLVHLARAVSTRSVVIFGPTPVSLYGYRENINIAEGECRNCFWSDIRWFQRCPKGYQTPKCMDQISSRKVIDLTLEVLQTDRPRQLPRAELVNFSMFDAQLPERYADVLLGIYKSAAIDFNGVAKSSHNKLNGCYVHASKNWEYLYIVEQIKDESNCRKIIDVGSGRGALQVYLSASGWDVTSVDLGFSEHSHDGRDYRHSFLETYGDRINFKFASIFNLPFPDDSFDAIVSVSVIEHLKNKEFALYELLRVLKPGGTLVLTFDITKHENLSETTDDTNRIEIFTPETFSRCMTSIGVYLEPPSIQNSLDQMMKAQIEGIPCGMTVGGVRLRKAIAIPDLSTSAFH
jgi:ADP-heptose:LPS heptosyltransferase/ubiquinone/menaquinone biosynthesis C-methylase UbiE